MARGNPNLKGMSDEERRAYYRDANRRWKERNPDYWKKVGAPRRLARIAAETPEEREERRNKEREYQEARRERTAELARERRQRDPEKINAYYRAHRLKNIERVRAIERESARRNYEKRKAAVKASNKKRRALMRGASAAETVHLIRVAERDGWKCHLCGGNVTRKNWSMDHLVPLSKGGEHTYRNVALAHRICNCRRSAGVIPAQLRLIG